MLLDRRTFLVKERVAVLKLTDAYDIFDPESSQQIGVAKDEPTPLLKYLRLVVKKGLLPTVVNVYEREGSPPVLTLRKGPGLFRIRVEVTSGGGSLGHFRSKAFSLGGGFFVFDATGEQAAEVKGDWKGWNFRFLDRMGQELGVVTKKWAGIGKELFTSADTYVIALAERAAANRQTAALLLAAGLAIDVVFKEKG
jgi:uncharacterized protein YxjI